MPRRGVLKIPDKLLVPTQPSLTFQSRTHSHTSLTRLLPSWVNAMGLSQKGLRAWVQSRLDPCPKEQQQQLSDCTGYHSILHTMDKHEHIHASPIDSTHATNSTHNWKPITEWWVKFTGIWVGQLIGWL